MPSFPVIQTEFDSANRVLEGFLIKLPRYATERNYDRGPESTVSRLSEFLRYGVIGEAEIVSKILAQYSFGIAEKFLQELCWRSYWKGWLELRPAFWGRYQSAVERLLQEYQFDSTYQRAVQGMSGLSFFDEWIRELYQTGYLHNHTRMWFASVWCYTLRLPWELGAELMYRHLIDGDAASNTLSWRWVAGLQTAGKQYLATPENIRRFSDGRWSPRPGELALRATAQTDSIGEIPATALSRFPEIADPIKSLLVLHDEQLAPPPGNWGAVLLLPRSQVARSVRVLSRIESFRSGLQGGERPASPEEFQAIAERVSGLGLTTVVVPEPTVGYSANEVRRQLRLVEEVGLTLRYVRTPWRETLYPLATRGFFHFWKFAQKIVVATPWR
jgi:deoxyribodipyrimidine photo-lyase